MFNSNSIKLLSFSEAANKMSISFEDFYSNFALNQNDFSIYNKFQKKWIIFYNDKGGNYDGTTRKI